MKATFRFYFADGDAPFYGGYKAGSMTEGEPVIFFNCEAILKHIKDEPSEERLADFKEITLSTITHEFCHAMQEWLNMEFDELQVEKILGAYNERWNVFSGAEEISEQDDEAVFGINDMLRYLDNEPESELKTKLLHLFNAQDLWRKAHEKHRLENENQNNS